MPCQIISLSILKINFMKKIIFVLFAVTCFQQLMAQTATTSLSNSYSKVVFVELGGPGIMSLNYDARFNKTALGGLGFRVGAGALSGSSSTSSTTAFSFPLGLNYLASKDNRNYFETGIGMTVLTASTHDDFFTSDNGTSTAAFGHLQFGYRLQPQNGGFVFRASVNPLFSADGFFPFYGGISLGYKF